MRKRAETIPQPAEERFGRFRRHRAGLLIRYAAPVVAVFVALMLTDRLRETFQGTPNSLFFCAIILSGWYGGFGPGILATLLSILSIKLSITPPPLAQTFPLGEMPHFVIFFIAGVFISWVCERQRRDEAALMRARDELEGKVQARTAALSTANQSLTIQIAERTRAECELQRLNRAWRVRSACNQALNRCNEEMDLLDQVCRVVASEGGYRLAWVGYAQNDAAKSVRPVARAGPGLRYLDTVAPTWGDDENGRGPTGTAIRTARPVVCNLISSDPIFAPWRARAEEYGLKSSVAWRTAQRFTCKTRLAGCVEIWEGVPVFMNRSHTNPEQPGPLEQEN